MEQFDLAVIGAGSGGVVIPDDFDRRRVALIEAGSFGGTCLNRGCIPTKMFVYTADLAMQARRASEFGLRAPLEGVDWPAIRDRIIARVEETEAAERQEWAESDVTVFEEYVRFAGPHELVIKDGTRIEAAQIVIATGGHPAIPPVVAESGVAFHTSDTVMRLDALPASMVILGGGYVAVELAHVFSSLGVEIHVVEMAATLVANLDADIARRFTALVSARWDVHLDATVTDVVAHGAGVEVVLDDGERVMGELLLVATGREPNTDDLQLDLAGVALSENGHIVVDEFGRAAPGVWALGDCSSPFELKHVANAEARTIAYNLAHADDLRPLPHEWVPSAVFSDPQIASVGARLQDLEERPFVSVTQQYGDVAYGWALQDHRGVCKLYADPETGTLLGAHILGHQASLLIAPLVQAAAHGQRVADIARGQFWIHPALSEVVENALLKLPVDQEVRSGQAH
ncbi:MAG TPA: mycothione reductase [Acidimicrobiales bacterium]